MNTFRRLLLATVCLLSFSAPASSTSIEVMADTAKSQQASVIYRGKPLNCKVDNCPVEAAISKRAPVNGPLLDPFGMPHKLPTSLRGGESSEDVIMAPTAVAAVPVTSSTPPEESSGQAAPQAPEAIPTAEIR